MPPKRSSRKRTTRRKRANRLKKTPEIFNHIILEEKTNGKGVPYDMIGGNRRSIAWFINQQHQDPDKAREWYQKIGYIAIKDFALEKIQAKLVDGYVMMLATFRGPDDASQDDWEMVIKQYMDPDDDGNYLLDGHLVYPVKEGYRPPHYILDGKSVSELVLESASKRALETGILDVTVGTAQLVQPITKDGAKAILYGIQEGHRLNVGTMHFTLLSGGHVDVSSRFWTYT